MKAYCVGFRHALRAGSGLTTIAVAGLMATPAFAQAASGQPVSTSPNNTTSQTPTSPELQTPPPGKGANASQTTTSPKGEQAIIITGTVSRQTQTASPVTVVSASNLQDRGITSVADAVQQLAANNAGADPASWSSLGFATGASAPSLRGFNDAYTITLFDGLRTAYYPLADDGYRNFVDINTIPESIVDRIEVLQDGASANYGADAVAGVVNVIIKKEIQGIHANGSYGVSEHGDAKERRFDLTLGYGSLADQGFNVYVNGEYQKDDPLWFRDRGYPTNSADQSRVCGTSSISGTRECGFNGIVNGIQWNGDYLGFGSTRVGFGLPYSAPGVPDTAVARQWQLLNPAAGCQGLPSASLAAANNLGGPLVPGTVCQQDLVNQYRQYNPAITRKGLNFHGTVNITPDIQAYAMANWYEVSTDNGGTPLSLTSGQTAAGGPLASYSRIYLPVYVCPQATPVVTSTHQVYFTGCNAANGVLNPNNPFAANGDMARLVERFAIPRQEFTDANTYRFSAGVSGSFSGFNFNLDATTSRVDLSVKDTGYIQMRKFLEAVGQGTYNFVDQSANSAAAIQQIAPDVSTNSVSKLSEITGTIGRDFAQLQGGNLNVAVGASYRTESISNPSSNPINTLDPFDRYESVNAVSASGSRKVWSGYYSVDVPAFTGFDAKAEGRYDHYSNGLGSAFSPKFELQYKPIPQVKLRGTWSRGFRVPSFNEVDTSGVPTTGYITSSINCATYVAFCAAHPNPSYYTGGYSYGLSSVGNPNLKPEKSTSWTVGTVLTPTPQLTMTVDYWHTKIKDIIIPSTQNNALIAQYYLNNGNVTVPAGSGIQLIPGVPDPNAPNALPLLGFYQAPYINSSSEVGSGFDLSAVARIPLNHSGLRLVSSFNASYLAKLTLSDPSLGVQPYAGTLSPCNITSCSGAPRWRGSWENTLDFGGNASISLTGYYTSGYSDISTDTGGILGDCNASALNGSMSQTYYGDNAPIRCHIKGTWDFDLTGQIKLFHHFTLYGNVINLFNTKPPYDPNAGYGVYQFNPAWADKNFIGRYFRIGAKVDW